MTQPGSQTSCLLKRTESVNQQQHEKVKSVGEMLESAEAVKGPAFANAVAGIFELMQTVEALGAIGVKAASAGANVENGHKVCVALIGAATSRFTLGMSDADADEAVNLASRMMDRRRTETIAALSAANVSSKG
jgi:hypothetical protein